MRIQELIEKLEEIKQEHGNVEVNIYKSFDKVTVDFSELHYDDDKNEAYLGIYN